jgi:hypothetical protein
MTLDDRSNHKWLCVEPRTGNYKPTKTKCWRDGKNEGSESDQPTRPVDLRDDGVDFDLPSREEIKRALKYLKNNKAAGT